MIHFLRLCCAFDTLPMDPLSSRGDASAALPFVVHPPCMASPFPAQACGHHQLSRQCTVRWPPLLSTSRSKDSGVHPHKRKQDSLLEDAAAETSVQASACACWES